MKKLAVVILALGLIFSPAQGFAGGFEASSWTESDSYLGKTGNKFVFGAKNLLLGWWDIFYEPHRFSNEGSNAFLGFLKGFVVDTPLNMIEGALHVITFPIPIDLPLPDGGVEFDTLERDNAPEDYKINQYARDNA